MFELMSRQERRRVMFLLPLVIVNAMVQVVGIASLMPFLALVANPDVIQTNQLLRWIYTTLGFQTTNGFLIFAGLGVLTLLVLSNGFTAWSQYRLLRLAWDVNHSLSVRMLRSYLFKPYVFFLEQNTSGLAKNILGEVKQAVTGFVIAWLDLIARGVTAVFIMGLLIAVNPVLAIVTFGTLGGAYGLLFSFLRRGLRRAGEDRAMADRGRYKAATESLTGVKEIKLLGKELPFLDRFVKPSREYSRHMSRQQAISTLPRYAFETIAFGGMLVIVLFSLFQGSGIAGLLPTLGVYAFATYRLLPAVQSIFGSLTKMRFSESAIELLHHDLERRPETFDPEPDRSAIKPLPFKERLELKGVDFTYPNARDATLSGFDMAIRARTTVALVGSTGAGKTTTVDLLLGLIAPDAGALLVDGVAVDEHNLGAWQKNLGYVPQEIYLADDTIAANIAFGIPHDAIDRAAVERAARAANIHDFIASDLDRGYNTEVGERGVRLSGGQRQRLGIARALYHDPDVLILDEATSALDSVTEQSIFTAVSEIGKSKTVVMIAHRISTVRACDVIYLLHRGKVLATGSYEEMIATSPEFRALAMVDRAPVKTGG